MTGLLAAALVATALAVVVETVRSRRRPARRLAKLPALVPARAGARAAATSPAPRPRRLVDRPRLVAALAGAAIALLFGGWLGIPVGAGVAVIADRLLRRLAAGSGGGAEAAAAADLPLAADLLAVALRGGAPVDRAVAAVAEVLPGPLGERLGRVSRLLRLGATAEEAWAQLAPVPGAGRLVRAAVRSAEHGGALADALTRLAVDLRADRVIAVEAAARRAGVLIVLPLGLCFLPAFMLAGLVPVIVAVLGDVL